MTRERMYRRRKVSKPARRITASEYVYGTTPSDYLIECLQDGMIGAEDLAVELMKYLSEDDIDDVIRTLGLDDSYYM